ncbi:hypothetical protein TSMEX_003209 [Taenia solium]|eukprot:TsM_000116100 transcript=TsM_000116100 gene=TsM_000116100
MGHASESERVIYADCFTAIVSCCLFTAEPRMKLVSSHRHKDNRNAVRLRVLASVTIKYLIDYVVEHRVEFNQPLDISLSIETTVGALCINAPVSSVLRGCLADEVFALRVVF